MLSQLTLQEQEAIIKLYVVFFARAPETSGADYWAREIQKLDSAMSVNAKMDSISDRMLSDSYAFNATIFSADMPLEDFIKQMYINALGRGETAFSALGRKTAPAREEIDYWIDEISSGRETRAGFGLRIFRDSEALAEGGTAPAEEIAKYKFQSAFNANRLAIAKEFVKQENSGNLNDNAAIIAGREAVKGAPMIRLGETDLSQYVIRKLTAPDDPSLYERVAPLSASSLVAEITAEEARAVEGSLPMTDSPFTRPSLTGTGDVIAAPTLATGVGGGGRPAMAPQNAAVASQNAGVGGGMAPALPPAPALVHAPAPGGGIGQRVANQQAVQRKFAFDEAADGGPGANDTLHMKEKLADNSMIDLSQVGDQVGRKNKNGAFEPVSPVQKNFENIDLSEVTSNNTTTITAHNSGSAITGGDGNDTINGGAGVDIINGGDGVDNITGGDGNDTINGGNGADTIDGGGGVDTLNGDDGDDAITGNVDDIMDGGADNDTLYLTGALQANTMIDLSKAGDQVGRKNKNGAFEPVAPVQQNFENADLSAVTAPGNGATIIARTQANGGSTIIGSNNNDTITGSVADIMDGGAGSDTLRLTGALANNVVINLSLQGAADDQVSGNAAQKHFEHVDLSLVTSNNITAITADSRGSTVTGGGGVDTINGGNGSDNLYGSAGDDIINGGGGNDTINGGDGTDTLNGGAGDDDITGSKLDIIDAGAGNDTLRLTGDLQAKTWIALSQSGDQLGVTRRGGFAKDGNVQQKFENVDLSGVTGGAGATITAHAGGSTITSSKNDDIIQGRAGNDVIDGGAGADRITGHAGNDVINGGAGNDLITGGAGNDIFFYNAGLNGAGLSGAPSTAGQDTITDFTAGSDKLRFIDGTAKMADGTAGDITIASGKITGFAGRAAANDNAGYIAKIAAIQGDARFVAVKKIVFFEHGAHTYVYHTGMEATHHDDIIVKLNNFRASNMDVSDETMLIGTAQTSVEDISFS